MKLKKGDKVLADSFTMGGKKIKENFEGIIVSCCKSYVEIKDTCPCDYQGHVFMRPHHLIKRKF